MSVERPVRFELVINLKKTRFPRTGLPAYTASFQAQVGDLQSLP
jgi:hypothetical protein